MGYLRTQLARRDTTMSDVLALSEETPAAWAPATDTCSLPVIATPAECETVLTCREKLVILPEN